MNKFFEDENVSRHSFFSASYHPFQTNAFNQYQTWTQSLLNEHQGHDAVYAGKTEQSNASVASTASMLSNGEEKAFMLSPYTTHQVLSTSVILLREEKLHWSKLMKIAPGKMDHITCTVSAMIVGPSQLFKDKMLYLQKRSSYLCPTKPVQ